MSGSDALIKDHDLEILLQQSDANGGDDLLADNAAQVTIRGELDKISLSDIFQTLSMSKMEGVLRIHRPLETRLIHFDETGVRLLNANRTETRKLGHRLVQSGMITPVELRSALLYQKKEQLPLGKVLVDQGILEPDSLEKALENQIEEDLYGLFTWESGSFEFYKGVSKNPELRMCVEKSPCFAINFVLLEVARRADEWREILRDIGSVHEVPLFVENVELPEMGGDDLTVCEAIDEVSTIRDLGDVTMLGLFTCAKSISELLRQGLIEFADANILLDLAREAAGRGDAARAIQMGHAIQERPHEIDLDLTRALAEALEPCREPRLVAEILLNCARSLNDSGSRLEAARLAYNYERHSGELLQFLSEQYEAEDLTDEPEYHEVLENICFALAEAGEFDAALRRMEDLEARTPDDPQLLTRKARLLQSADRCDEALVVLKEVRVGAEEDGDPQRLAKVYEQILKIDPRNRGVQKALRDLRFGKTKARRRRLVAVGAFLLVCAGIYVALQIMDANQRIEAAQAEIRQTLSTRDLAKARTLLAGFQKSLGDGEHWETVKNEIRIAEAAEKALARATEKKKVRAVLENAAKTFAAGDISGGLKIYQTQLDRKSSFRDIPKMVEDVSRGQLAEILKPLESLDSRLSRDIPGPAPDVGTLAEYREAAKVLAAKDELDISLARALLSHADHPTLQKILERSQLEGAFMQARRILATKAMIGERIQSYAACIARLEKNERLDPVFAEARRAETKYDFRSAEALYRELLEEYKANPTLAPRFEANVEKYSAINSTLRKLVLATKKADFLGARTQYRLLRSKYKEFPWGHLIKLPIQVTTTPKGATVRLNGESLGKTPLALECFPALRSRVIIELEGFRTETAELLGDTTGLVESTLTLAPRWRIKSKGAVEKAPVSDGSRIYMVDRSGGVVAWSQRTRKRAWRQDVGDLSGLLTRPVLYKNTVIVGSLDGPLRSLDAMSGGVRWTLPNLATESTPVRLENLLVIATSDGQLRCIDLETRATKWELDLGSKTRLDLQLIDNEFVVAVLDDGTARAISIDKQTDRSSPITLDAGLPTQPLVHRGTLVVGTDEGNLSGYDVVTGQRLWRHQELGELRWQPCGVDRYVVVTAAATLDAPVRAVSFGIRNGKDGPIYEPPEGTTWSCNPAFVQDSLLLGDRSGTLVVLDKKTLTVRYRIKGRGAACAQPVTLRGRTVICSFDGKELLVFPELR